MPVQGVYVTFNDAKDSKLTRGMALPPGACVVNIYRGVQAVQQFPVIQYIGAADASPLLATEAITELMIETAKDAKALLDSLGKVKPPVPTK